MATAAMIQIGLMRRAPGGRVGPEPEEGGPEPGGGGVAGRGL